jgi:DNA (cytosine-5)-methyltransferase 1
MRYASVCSGIEAPTVAWEPLGWEPVFYSEIEKFPRAVLARHYPDVPLHGDFTAMEGMEHGAVDLLVAGTPCQSFSVAGRRAGLDDPRGDLALQFLKLARLVRPRWIVFENVPGLLSIDGGLGFAAFLRTLVDCGYGCCWRVLDAKFAGVPQLRRRVWVVGYLGDWRPAAAVLLEPESLRWDSPPRREAGEGVAATLASSPPSRRNGGSDPTAGHMIAHALSAEGFDASEDGTGRGTPLVAATLTQGAGSAGKGGYAGRRREDDQNLVAYGGNRTGGPLDIATACNAHGGAHGRQDFESETFLVNARQDPVTGIQALDSNRSGTLAWGVRRLTPRECERLMGLPDDYTRIPVRHYARRRITRLRPTDRWECDPDGGWWLMAADGPRYRAIGNSMVVPELRWIGERIAMVDGVNTALGVENERPGKHPQGPPPGRH